METSWIVTADAGRARFFAESDPSQPLQEIEDMVNEMGRMRPSEIYTDRVGPTGGTGSIHDTGGQVPNKQYEPPTTPEEQARISFAKAVAGYLLKGHQERRFQKLTLIADPKFLGALRMALDPQLKPLVDREINKDLTHSSGQQLREQIKAHKTGE
jgi:protein required for attachment to host cells